MPPLSPGDRLGPYEIVGPLDAGGMGQVYRARDSRLRRDVAVKVLHSHVAATPEHVERLGREARAAGGLNHPNIVAVFNVGTQGGAPYVVSELLEGESLRHRLQRGPLSYRDALEFGIQISQALGAAHAKGICHRDRQTRQRVRHARSPREAARFRPGEARAPQGGARRFHGGPHPAGRGAWHLRVHVPGASARRTHRRAHRPVFPRCGALRDVHRHPRVPPRVGRRHDVRRGRGHRSC